MGANEGLPARVVKITLHEKVKQMSSIGADGAEFGVTTLQDLITEGRTHICTALEKCTRELRRET